MLINASAGAAETTPADKPASQPVELKADTFSLPAPEGYVWKKVRELPQGEGKVLVFTATKTGSDAKIVLIVEPGAVAEDAQRAARIKGDYNGMVTGLHDGGYTELKGGAPEIKTPVPERVQFGISGKDKGGKPVSMRGILVFGKNTYHFQVSAGSEEEVGTLAKVSLAIKE